MESVHPGYSSASSAKRRRCGTATKWSSCRTITSSRRIPNRTATWISCGDFVKAQGITYFYDVIDDPNGHWVFDPAKGDLRSGSTGRITRGCATLGYPPKRATRGQARCCSGQNLRKLHGETSTSSRRASATRTRASSSVGQTSPLSRDPAASSARAATPRFSEEPQA